MTTEGCRSPDLGCTIHARNRSDVHIQDDAPSLTSLDPGQNGHHSDNDSKYQVRGNEEVVQTAAIHLTNEELRESPQG